MRGWPSSSRGTGYKACFLDLLPLPISPSVSLIRPAHLTLHCMADLYPPPGSASTCIIRSVYYPSTSFSITEPAHTCSLSTSIAIRLIPPSSADNQNSHDLLRWTLPAPCKVAWCPPLGHCCCVLRAAFHPFVLVLCSFPTLKPLLYLAIHSFARVFQRHRNISICFLR